MASGCASTAVVTQVNPTRTASIETRFLASEPDPKFEKKLATAVARILYFSEKEGLGISDATTFVSKVFVYGTKAAFDKTLTSSPSWQAGISVPINYVGYGQSKQFHVLSFTAYQRIHPDASVDDYTKLLTHELAHLFHISFLQGQEDEMGPTWFFEGFACYVAGQYQTSVLPEGSRLTKIKSQTGRGSYEDYAAIFRYLTRRSSVRELLIEFRRKSNF